uniref:Uncharacterized protein n=1 Tax=Rhizophora mucronata TaxID=61149 RepID=A0A2P2PMP3_RHIMU
MACCYSNCTSKNTPTKYVSQSQRTLRLQMGYWKQIQNLMS